MTKLIRTIFLICFICFIFEVWGFGESIIPADSIVKVTGYVYDSLSGKPVDSAVVSYEQLPYGSTIGLTRTATRTGYFEFNTTRTHDYRVEVKAYGYKPVEEEIHPASEGSSGIIKKKYYLTYAPEEGEVLKLNHLIFAQGKSEITKESFEELDDLVSMLKDNPNMVIQLEGHTDFRGSASKNMQLSQDRVESVKTYLMRKGIKGSRILTRAFGGTHPLSREATEEAARMNRRVEVRIIRK